MDGWMARISINEAAERNIIDCSKGDRKVIDEIDKWQVTRQGARAHIVKD